MPDVAKLEAAGSPLTMAPGAPWTVCITPGPNQVLYTSDAYPGRIYKLSLEGKVLGVLGESGKQLKQFGWIHEIACPSENVLYVGRIAELEGAETDPASVTGLSPGTMRVGAWLRPRGDLAFCDDDQISSTQ